LQDQIRGMCDRFAAAGFDALVPDLYNGIVVPYHDTDAANKEMSSVNFVDATEQTVRGAAPYLKRNDGKVGLTGFCMGGAVTIIGACGFPNSILASMLALTTLFYTALQIEYFNLQTLVHYNEILGHRPLPTLRSSAAPTFCRTCPARRPRLSIRRASSSRSRVPQATV
jgi:dienelactone hydrolase